jgi:hypothetical protein
MDFAKVMKLAFTPPILGPTRDTARYPAGPAPLVAVAPFQEFQCMVGPQMADSKTILAPRLLHKLILKI